MAKQLLYTDDARKKLLAGAEKLAHAVGLDARADRAERHHRQVVRRPHRHEGRRDGLQGDRPARPVREHGREARQRRRPEDRPTSPATAPPPRPCSRWPSTRKGCGSSVGAQPDGGQARHRQGRRQGGRAPRREADAEADQEGGDAERRQPSPRTTTRRSASSWPMRSRRSARTASSRSRRARPPRRSSTSSRGCSSTRATSRRTSRSTRRT